MNLQSCIFTSYHVISCVFMSCHVLSCLIMSYHVLSCLVMSCHVLSCLAGGFTSYHVISCVGSAVSWLSSHLLNSCGCPASFCFEPLALQPLLNLEPWLSSHHIWHGLHGYPAITPDIMAAQPSQLPKKLPWWGLSHSQEHPILQEDTSKPWLSSQQFMAPFISPWTQHGSTAITPTQASFFLYFSAPKLA